MQASLSNLLGALAVGLDDLQGNAMAAAIGRDARDAAILATLRARPGSTVGHLAATVGLTHSGAVRRVDRLAEDGLIVRTEGEDRRTVAIDLTAAGAAAAKQALAARELTLERCIRGLDVGVQHALRQAASDILSGLPATRIDAWRICRYCDHGRCRGLECPVGSAVP